MRSLRDRLQQILIRDRLITEEDLNRALEEQAKVGGGLSRVLVEMGLISESDLARVLSEGLGMPPIDIGRMKIDPEVLKFIPRDLAAKHLLIPISRIRGNLTLAMADPLNVFVIDNIKTLTGLNIIPIIGQASQIREAVEKYYTSGSSETLEKILEDIRGTEDLEWVKDSGAGDAAAEDVGQEAPMIKLTDTIIRQAVAAKASDVFIEPMESSLRIRYRVDGVIREIDRMPRAFHLPIVSRIKVVSNLDISEHRLPQDGRFKTILGDGRDVDFRVNVLPTAFGEKVVLRVLDKSAGILDLDRLGFQPAALERLKSCALKPHGMILSCGPTGSGKTTTLYSVLRYVDSPEKNIVTVEDPVEYQVPGMNQVNVHPSTGLSFASSLRAILRQDPDIIMIGEIRESETLDIAVKAALTGHLVLSSLHTTTAAGSVIRMMNMGIEPFLLCSSVVAVVGQRLLRRICRNCRRPYPLPEEACTRLGLGCGEDGGVLELWRGTGCDRCARSGYAGRVGIAEVLVMTRTVKEQILARAGEPRIKEAARREGMQTMREDGLEKARAGLTTLEEVLRVTAPDDPLDEGESRSRT